MQDMLELMTPGGVKRSVHKGTILLYQGEVPRSAYFVQKGVVKVYSISSAGTEQIVAFYVAGDLLPASWIFGKTTSTLYYYEALTDCSVLAVERRTMLELLRAKPRLQAKIFDYIMTNYTSSLLRITSLEQSRASEKIMFTLYYLSFRYGKEVTPGIFSVQLGLTQAIIADMVGVTRETTVVELSKLKKAGVVTYNTKEYVIDKPKLERLMGEDSFSSLV